MWYFGYLVCFWFNWSYFLGPHGCHRIDFLYFCIFCSNPMHHLCIFYTFLKFSALWKWNISVLLLVIKIAVRRLPYPASSSASSPPLLLSFRCSILSVVLLPGPWVVVGLVAEGLRWQRAGVKSAKVVLLSVLSSFCVRFVMADQFWILGVYCLKIRSSPPRWPWVCCVPRRSAGKSLVYPVFCRPLQPRCGLDICVLFCSL